VCLFAQEWTDAMAQELRSVWNPQTRLGRAAPRGGPIAVLHAAALEDISVNDVKFAALGMKVLPDNIARPQPKPPPDAEAPADLDDASIALPAEPGVSPELAQSRDS
jgi:hypothetical protein